MNHEATEARKGLRTLLVAGAIALLAGAVIAALTWPTPSIDGDTGHPLGLLIGALLALAGQVMLGVAIVGYGVALGHAVIPRPASLPSQPQRP